MVWLPDGERLKHFEDIFIRFDRMYTNVTDRHTNTHTQTHTA